MTIMQRIDETLLEEWMKHHQLSPSRFVGYLAVSDQIVKHGLRPLSESETEQIILSVLPECDPVMLGQYIDLVDRIHRVMEEAGFQPLELKSVRIPAGFLDGNLLDWAVATSMGYTNLRKNPHRFDNYLIMDPPRKEYGAVYLYELDCKSWEKVGQIIDREGISINFHPNEDPAWTASSHKLKNAYLLSTSENAFMRGRTAAIAALRCYVADKLGEIIEIPNEVKALLDQNSPEIKQEKPTRRKP